MDELKEELEYANQMFHDLSVFTNGVKTEINEAKELLVSTVLHWNPSFTVLVPHVDQPTVDMVSCRSKQVHGNSLR